MIRAGTNAMTRGQNVALEMFGRARRAVQRVFVPALDMYPDGGMTIENVSVLFGTTSPAQPATPICDGFLVGISASVQGGTVANAATTKIAVTINGSTNIFQTGTQGQGFVSIQQLLGSFGGIFRVMAPMKQAVPYQVYVKNDAAAGTTISDITLWFVDTSSPPLVDGD